MAERLRALLIYERQEPFESLRRTLQDLCVDTYSAATCREAEDLIFQCRPHVIFTETSVNDGSGVRVLNRAETANLRISVIVVSAVPDTRLYLSVMEGGAFDFVAPPFEHAPLEFIVRSAALNVDRHRGALAHTALH